MSDDARFTPAGSSELRIEKLRRPVSVVFTVGAPIEGEMFLAERARFRSDAETPLDVLNDAAPFFPIRVPDGATILVSKANVAVIEAANVEEGDDPLDSARIGLEVQVTLSQGLVRDGTLFPETSRDRPRLLDFLNAYHDTFLALYAGEVVYLINRHQIAHVRAMT